MTECLGKVLDEVVFKFSHEQSVIWEERLRLHLRPRPYWMPKRLWCVIVNLVVLQSSEI